MPAPFYRLPFVLAAIVCLAGAGCADLPTMLKPAPMPSAAAPPPAAPPPQTAVQQPAARRTAANTRGDIDTDATIWTVLGIAKEPPKAPTGPITGVTVSPILWQAAHDTLNFVKVASEDPMTGRLLTDWYSPPNKPNERFRVAVFILSRWLQSDSLAVRVERQIRSDAGAWQDTGVDRKLDDQLVFTILNRARAIRQTLTAKKA